MLRIDETADSARFLGLGHGLECQGRLSRRFRPVNLDDAPPRKATHAQSNVEPQRAGRNRLHLNDLTAAKAHDRALAKGTLDLGHRCFDSLVLVHTHYGSASVISE